MLIVKTELRASDIHGLGVFSLENIQKDAPVIRAHPLIDLVYLKKDLDTESFPPVAQDWLQKYPTYFGDKMFISIDETRFLNHSSHPSLIFHGGDYDWFYTAAWDIKIGEELTCDYSIIDDDFPVYSKGW